MSKVHPPVLAGRILRTFLREDLVEEVIGDLDEKFKDTVRKKSLARARLNYWYQVMQYLRPFALRKSKRVKISHYAMLKSYFKVGWRNMIKQKMYSSIKVGGFAIGIAACLLITLFILDELSYDRHTPDGDRIFRVIGVGEYNGQVSKGVHFPAPFAAALKADFPEIEYAGRYNPVELFGAGGNEIRRADRVENTYEDGFVFVDQEMLSLFKWPMIYGNRDHALEQPMSIVITRRMSEKYFGNEDPVGKQFVVNDKADKTYTIGGVIENFPANSHLQFDFLITLTQLEFYKGEQSNWGASNYPTYLLLREGSNADELAEKMGKLIIEKYVLPMMIENGVVNAREEVSKARLEMQPLADIHLYSGGIGDGLTHGDIRFVWLFGAVAGFILVIACINFINLSTAKSANRAKEVGLRKVVGSFRSNLIRQFLTESVLFSLFSFVAGILLAWLLLPFFNVLAAKSLVFPWTKWWFIPTVLAAVLSIGVIAGLYPSFYLSSFRPIQVLKGNLARGSKSSGTRGFLVVFQFTTSIVLIVGTFIIYQQMQYILNKKVGYEKDQVIMIQGTNTLGDQITTFKHELQTVPHVKSASISDYLPVKGTKRNGNTFWKEGRTKEDVGVAGQKWRIDADYIKTLGMTIVKGRDFSESMQTDAGTCIINEAMAREMAFTDPIGQRITNGSATWSVIGVVQDFNFDTMKENILPLVMTFYNSPNIVSVKVDTENMADVLTAIGATWKKFAPNQPIRYSFLDDSYARMYDDVQRMGRIFSTFATLAIIVACLGLFALSAFMVEQRGKEISIRIVLGAPMQNIFRLLTQNFIKLVLISIVIAVPIAWYLMRQWLNDFAYRIEIGWEVFAVAGAMAILIAVLTISYQSIKAALIDPVKNLRAE